MKKLKSFTEAILIKKKTLKDLNFDDIQSSGI